MPERSLDLPGTPALLTDRYELTMLAAARHSGAAGRRATFEVFSRSLRGRRYGVVAGIGRLLPAIAAFRFDDDTLAWLRREDVVDEQLCHALADYRFTGDVWAYAEGECFFPGSPIVVVDAPFGEAVLLETLVLSVLNHDSAVAAAASRMVAAADGRPIIEMGSRRTHEAAAVAAARAAYLAGFSSTSNLAAGRLHGVPTRGTSAHAFTLVHDSERQAFTAQVEVLGRGTTLLVDTYDVRAAVRTAVEVAGPDLGAVRLDSGDLGVVAREVRAQLDELGATRTRIVVTSDLDEWAIGKLAAAPVDGYGVGTSVVTGSGSPTAGLVYKLVAVDGRPVAKRSTGKPSRGGRKWAVRRSGRDGVDEAEVVVVGGVEPVAADGDRPLLRHVVRGGRIVDDDTLPAARARHATARARLPVDALKLSPGDPALPTEFVEGQ